MHLGTPFGAFLDPVADKVFFIVVYFHSNFWLCFWFTWEGFMLLLFLWDYILQLMVAATLILLCTKPLESLIFRQTPWILAVPSIAIIGREVIQPCNSYPFYLLSCPSMFIFLGRIKSYIVYFFVLQYASFL